MVVRRGAFTLIEVLISLVLLSLVLLALYKSVAMLRDSNRQLFEHLQVATEEKKGVETLFLDIVGSDGNITIIGNELSRLCIQNSINSLYGLSAAQVCWVVTKKEKRLLRIEGNGYMLPLNSGDRVEVDEVMRGVELFRVYRQKSEVLVVLKQKGKRPITFLAHGVPEIIKKASSAPKKLKSPPKNSPATRAPTRRPNRTFPNTPSPSKTPNNQTN